jgi:DNA invertase Pin-like site-specific DNA recombinase
MNAQKYILYARKSSEDKNRQVTSIEDQIIELKRLAENRNITIVEIIKESQSAKKPGRKGFNVMLEKIHSGEADGILCWKLDRLSRNALDGGQISWMLQNNVIEHIITIGSDYKPSDNVLMMAVELGMATQYVKDLKLNVSRGTRRKAERGWFPSAILPIGYKHNPDYKINQSNIEIIPDPITFPIVKSLWEKLLSGAYNLADIKREADKQGLVNKCNKPYAINTFHLLFKNEFYAGYFYWKNEDGEKKRHRGNHTSAVSISEFEQAQKVLNNNGHPTRLRTYSFPFRGIIKCGECNGHVTAEHIHQVICTSCKYKFSVKNQDKCKKCGLKVNKMKNPSVVIKDYYRCIRKRKSCKQKSIEEKNIEDFIKNKLDEISINKEFYDWAMRTINRMEDEKDENVSLLKNMESKKKNVEIQLDGLLKMRSLNEISSQVYLERKEELNKELYQLTRTIEVHTSEKTDWKKIAKARLKLCLGASKTFLSLDEKGKKKVLLKLGSNLTLLDKKLDFITLNALFYIKKMEKAYIEKTRGFQPKNIVEEYRNLEGLLPLNPNRLAE